MFWLSTLSNAPQLDAIAANSRPWAILRRFWKFSDRYGEYQSRPPSLRRQFIIEMEQGEQKDCGSESC